MRQRNALIPLAMAGMLVLPQAGWSQNTWDHTEDYVVEGFLGGGVGFHRLEEEEFLGEDREFEDDRLSWKLFGGLDFARVFAVELAYLNFGETTDGPATFDADGWSLAGMIAIPLTPHFAPYGKLGVLYWDADQELGPVSQSETGDDVFFGLGARFTISKQSDVRLEYERFTVADNDLDMASVNFQLRF